jgi:hypothetical protein
MWSPSHYSDGLAGLKLGKFAVALSVWAVAARTAR